MWLCILPDKQFEGTFENAHWRKVKQMQPMWPCILPGKQFEETFDNAHWRKVKQMQPMRLCLFSGKPFEETFENAQWRKVKQMQPMWLCLFSGKQFKDTFENARTQSKHATNVTLPPVGIWQYTYHHQVVFSQLMASQILHTWPYLRLDYCIATVQSDNKSWQCAIIDC